MKRLKQRAHGFIARAVQSALAVANPKTPAIADQTTLVAALSKALQDPGALQQLKAAIAETQWTADGLQPFPLQGTPKPPPQSEPSAPALPVSSLPGGSMLLFNTSRSEMLTCMAPGGIVCEVGTATGNYAERLIENLKPSKLHLIDPWSHQSDADYQLDSDNTTNAEGERRFTFVSERFAGPIGSGQVILNRGLSTNVVDRFPDEYFDLVYIDANHTYAGCLGDLYSFDRKVKRTGFLCGHDYQTVPEARNAHNGVIQAVNQFVVERGYEFIALTFEGAPTYVLTKDRHAPQVQAFLDAMATKFQVMACIRHPEHKIFNQVVVPYLAQQSRDGAQYFFSWD